MERSTGLVDFPKSALIRALERRQKEVRTWAAAAGVSRTQLNRCLIIARRQSIERFLECLIRENLVELDCSPTSRGIQWLTIPLRRGGGMIGFRGCRQAIRRVHILTAPAYITGGQRKRLTPALLVQLLEPELSHVDGDWAGLWADFAESCGTSFLLQVLRVQRGGQDAVAALRGLSVNSDEAVVALEQWAINGHFLHPCPKARTGLSLNDDLAYAPEARGEYRLQLATLEPSRVFTFRAQPESSPNRWMSPALAAAIGARGFATPAAAVILPVHPLQLKCAVPRLQDDPGVTFPLVEGPLARPLTAYRTVYLPEIGLYLKLPLRVRITSAVRTLSTKSRQNSIALTQLLDGIIASGGVPASFVFLREETSVGAGDEDPLFKDVGFIIREACARYVAPGDIVIPALCLSETSPDDPGRTILQAILQQAAGTNKPSNQAIKGFFADYAALYLGPCLKLLAEYGIGLEAHLENCLTVFRAGKPVRALYRDNDAVSICTSRLDQRDSQAAKRFHPDSWSVSADPFAAQEKLQHSLIHSHLGELVRMITVAYPIGEGDLWRILRDEIFRVFEDLKRLDHVGAAPVQDREFFFRDEIELKSLTRMRLANTKNDYLYTPAANPLSAEVEQG